MCYYDCTGSVEKRKRVTKTRLVLLERAKHLHKTRKMYPVPVAVPQRVPYQVIFYISAADGDSDAIQNDKTLDSNNRINLTNEHPRRGYLNRAKS